MKTPILILVFLNLQVAAQKTNSVDLARAYCQGCHLFPEPSLLTKETWINGALRQMAPFLGAARLDLERKPDGKILKEAGIFPATPLISERDWQDISRFYRDNAPDLPLPQKEQAKIEHQIEHFESRPLKYPGSTHLTSLVRFDPGKSRVFVGNAGGRSLDIVSLQGKLISRVELESPPVDLTVRPEGVYVTLIGDLFPSDERKGKLVLVSRTNDVPQVRTILDHLARPTSASFADLNGDSREDVVLCSFGNYLGKLAWYERTMENGFVEHLLLEQPGAVNSIANREIYVLMAQAREGIHRFKPTDHGFAHEIIAEFHPAFGASHLELVDFNKDGFPDLLVTNGDNGDYPSRLKNYHGVRIYLNDGTGKFRERWFYALNGAFKALAADFDGDNDLDIAAISFFPDYREKPHESFVYFENRGTLDFVPRSFAGCTSGRWLTMDVADAEGDGDVDIVLGSFAAGPASIPIPPALYKSWRTNGYSVLCLENTIGKITHAR